MNHGVTMGKLDTMTVSQLCRLFIERHSKVFKKSWNKDELYIQTYILPVFGNREACSIKRGEIELFHKSFNGIFIANRILSLISAIYNKGIDWELVNNNPAKRIRKFTEVPRDLFIPRQQISIFISELNKCPLYFQQLIKFVLITGCRKTEALNLRWDDIDFDSEIIVIRDRKNKRDLTIPLILTIRTVILSTPQLGEYVFSRNGKKQSDVKRPWFELRERLRKSNFLHRKQIKFNDLRRTVGSWLAQNGASSKAIADVLGQVDLKSTERYLRLQMDNKIEIMEKLPSLD